MTIAKRLLMLILLSVLGLVAVGGIGLSQMGRINDGLNQVHDNSIPSILKVGEIETIFLRYRTRVMYHLLATEASAMAEHEKKLEEYKAMMYKDIKDYEALLSDDKDRQYLETTKTLLVEYFKTVDHALELSRTNQNTQARDYLLGTAYNTAQAVAKNLDEHAQYNETLAEGEVAKAEAAYSSGRTLALLSIVVVAACAITLGFFTYRHVSGSLNSMAEMFSRIAQELDFTGRMPVKGSDEVARTGEAFNQLLARLQDSLREINQQASAVSEAASRVSTASQQMSVASGQQSESASSMAATMEEMTVSINHVADRATEADQLSSTSGRLAKDGTRIIGSTVEGINSIAATVREASEQISRLEQNSERVNSVVAVIKEVADQTNLLALNAAIEAARAGEQGRGFAVVADEVRKLAERTTQSTQEIGRTIAEMQSGAQVAVQSIQAVVERVQTGVSQAEKANEAILEIGSSSEQTVDMVGDITEAIREQSSASTSIAQQVERIAQMSEENSAAAQATSDTAGELARLSESMQRVVSQYRV
ncbi:methyl-accepting chemotaxis protein [Azovibrio restrictus]|uniref:methyl-accepting chemotaxis protein n=1 Tax=Azovibrio restrictus TaxID=146938 RepID=UPI0026F0B4AF|nr:methyl-accepting chemotaxis protein [Azovibrio restrictus]MDD3484027.1 methyl-accepting chemotaxis protein [Azovibrio restrictus]